MKSKILPLICLGLTTTSLQAKKLDETPSASQKEECLCSAKSFSRAFTSVAKKATPSVVFIKVEGFSEKPRYNNPHESLHEEFFNRFFGTQPRYPQPSQPQSSQGSGFIITKDGYIVTNYHVVKDAAKITVVLQEGREMELPGTFIGGDPHTDIAIVKIEGDSYPYLKFADSENVEVGEWCIAIGNPFQLEASVTVGVISAKGRQNLQITDLEDFIQTDAAINPGNSGGPLLNLEGDVIGINTAIVSRSGGYMGIGFAIPSNMVENIKNQIVSNGKINPGFLGVQLQPIDRDLAESFKLKKAEGALVSEVVTDSPADKAGLKSGDIILEVNGSKVKSPTTLRREIMLMQPGQVAKITLNRDGKIKKISVTLGNHPKTRQDTSKAAEKLGLEIEELNSEKAHQMGYSTEEEGVLISGVRPGTLGQLAGIRPGSIIIAVNHNKVKNLEEFNKALEETTSNGRILLLINYKGQMRFYSLKLK